MVEESNELCVMNVDQWLKENEEKFKPPVCNSVMAKGFMNIMFVGGPNVRKDYHIEQGEELFYMIRGDMCLKIMEQGEPKDIHIKQGEVFVLPSRIPHSPQRMINTLGLVVERERSDDWDCVRYFCEDGKSILWNKYFHLHSLVKDFPPVIKEYFQTEEYKTGIPKPGVTSEEDEEKIKVDYHTTVDKPFALKQWVANNIGEINNGGKTLFEKGELKLTIYGSWNKDHMIESQHETWLWMQDGESICTIDKDQHNLKADDSIIVPPNKKMSLNITGGYCLVLYMDPLATPQI